MDDIFDELLAVHTAAEVVGEDLAAELLSDHISAQVVGEGLAAELPADQGGQETAERSGAGHSGAEIGGEREGGDEAGNGAGGEDGNASGGDDDLLEDLQAASSSTGESSALGLLFGASQPKKAPLNRGTTAHPLFLHACKRPRLAERRTAELQEERRPVDQAWDLGRLRSGDRLGAHNAYSSNQFSFAGVLKAAWNQIGRIRTLRHGGIESVSHELDVLCTVSAAARRVQSEFVAASLAELVKNKDSTLVVQRFYDATPVRVRFGQLQGVLEPIARYPLFDDQTQRWKTVSLDDFREATGRSHRMQWGTVELLGQGLTCQQLTDGPAGTLEGFEIVAPPQVLQAANSSCIYAATEDLCPELVSRPTGQGLAEIRKVCKMVLLSELPDACKPNLRKRAQTIADTSAWDNVFSTNGTCGCHQAHRVVESKEKWSIGNVYAIAFSCAQPALQRRLKAALRRWLEKDLVFLRGEPSEADTRRNRLIMRHTFRRAGSTVAGVGTFDGPSVRPNEGGGDDAVRQEDLGQAAEEFLRVWNSDWTSLVPLHVCTGCCESREQAVDLMLSTTCQLNLLQASDCRLPSTDDWRTCGEACGRSSLGMLCNDLLGVVFAAGCPSWNEIGEMDLGNADDAEEGRDVRAKIQKKAWRSRCVLRESVQRRKILLLCWLGGPVEDLMSQLQWLDRAKQGLMDVQIPDGT